MIYCRHILIPWAWKKLNCFYGRELSPRFMQWGALTARGNGKLWGKGRRASRQGDRPVTWSSRKVIALTAITYNVRLRNTGKAMGNSWLVRVQSYPQATRSPRGGTNTIEAKQIGFGRGVCDKELFLLAFSIVLSFLEHRFSEMGSSSVIRRKEGTVSSELSYNLTSDRG
jgi:hypothetical protein